MPAFTAMRLRLPWSSLALISCALFWAGKSDGGGCCAVATAAFAPFQGGSSSYPSAGTSLPQRAANLSLRPPPALATIASRHRWHLFYTVANGDGNNGAKRTLYDVLRSSPDATRQELKTQYVALARESHPDAIRGSVSDDADDTDRPDFTEIAAAWRLLSDPKERRRYDRTLLAEKFAEDAERLASAAVIPTVRSILDKFAAATPVIRRTAATAAAGIEAAAKDAVVARNGEGDLGRTIASAVRASVRAGRALDRMELVKKASELEGRAGEETVRAASIRDELASVAEERMRAALRSADYDLSSTEALRMLDGLDAPVDNSLGAVMRRKTLADEIAALEEAERQYHEKYDAKAAADAEYAEQTEKLRRAEHNVETASAAERRAREALDAARDLVVSTRKAAAECASSASALEGTARRCEAEVERTGRELSKKRERVRRVLRRKEEAVRSSRAARGFAGDGGGGAMPKKELGRNLFAFNSTEGTRYFDAQAVATTVASLGRDVELLETVDEGQIRINLDKLHTLRDMENLMTDESVRLDSRVVRLKSRARKLRNSADEMMGDTASLPTPGLHP